jgi:hypothetical protein
MCKWNEITKQREERIAADRAKIAACLGTGLVTKVPMGLRNVTPANMKKLVRGETIVEAGQESVA